MSSTPQPTDAAPNDQAGQRGDAGAEGGEQEVASPHRLIVDDFEDGDHLCSLGGAWETNDDSKDGGRSILDISKNAEGQLAMDGEGYESARSLYLSYSLDEGDWQYDPYVWWWVTLNPDAAPVDMSGYAGFSYWFKGSSHAASVTSLDIHDYDYYRTEVPASEEWTHVNIPFSDLQQQGWGEFVALDLANAAGFTWFIVGDTGDTGEVWIDDLQLVESFPSSEGVESPDAVIHEAAPPADAVIESVEVFNPLQSLAMRELNRGYNITGWLEQGPFEGFAYDEQYVAKLAAAGFEALRLPIDLDQYIVDRDAYFAGETEFAIDPLLFTILDSFEQWTGNHGLSLTIDYHQYDGSVDLEDPFDVAAMIGLWSGIAEHFADTPREDLFFELLNEPELSGNGTAVSQATWTQVAELVIAAIRDHDSERVLLFGDVQWNGIASLVQRVPLDDPRIIYVFHFYEPFIFTHQGAAWTNMQTIHDIPYPYSAERWSRNSRELGLDAPQIPDWVIMAADNYYRTGNKSAIRNQIVEVKEWAVQNDVPVICNEFGAYDRTSQIDDRVRYYADLSDIFAELEIPWHHWHMGMDEQSGTVNPRLLAALRLE